VGIIRYPASDDVRDVEAAGRAVWTTRRRSLWSNTFFSDPVCFGKYPDDALQRWARDMPRIAADDMATIRQPLDFCGVNIYQGDPVKPRGEQRWKTVPRTMGTGTTIMQWPV
jgi:beta-glucosidase